MITRKKIEYYDEMDGNPVFSLLLDARKAFDKVSYNVLFNLLLDKSLCSKIDRLLYYMCLNQSCYVT